MLMVNMNKDYRDYSPKIIGQFTMRQLICIAPIAAVYSRVPALTSVGIPLEIAMFLLTIPAIPFFLCGWLSVFGMPFEKFVFFVVKNWLLVPRIRYYSTEEDEPDVQEDSKKKKQKTFRQKRKYRKDLRRYGAVM